jgi:enterochelin esterase-like enzyme
MRNNIIVLLVLLCCAGSPAQDFQSFCNYVNSLPAGQRSAAVDSFLLAVPSTPFIEYDTLAHFLYRGAATSAAIAGDMTGWSPGIATMSQLAGTNLWYYTHAYEPDARLDYKIVVNGSDWLLDPRNPHQMSGGFGPNSELRMPQYQPPSVLAYNGSISHGTIRDTVMASSELGDSRTVRVYLPPGYGTASDSYPVILFHDGPEYISLGLANNSIDGLIAAGLIRPVIGVFVPPNEANRHEEYAASKITQFSSFIVNKVMPWVSSRYRVKPEAAYHATAGASDGGNISLYLAMTYPNVFGMAAAQSSNITDAVSTGFNTSPRLPLTLYCDLGTYDISSLLPLVRNFIPIIQSKGYPHIYHEYHEGHSWGNWRARVPDILMYFFPGESAGVKQEVPHPGGYELEQNSPNPGNPATTIGFRLPSAQHVVLKLYDLAGREVMTLFDGVAPQGRREVRVDASQLSSGIYFYSLQGREYSETRKMVIVR